MAFSQRLWRKYVAEKKYLSFSLQYWCSICQTGVMFVGMNVSCSETLSQRAVFAMSFCIFVETKSHVLQMNICSLRLDKTYWVSFCKSIENVFVQKSWNREILFSFETQDSFSIVCTKNKGTLVKWHHTVLTFSFEYNCYVREEKAIWCSDVNSH